MMTARIGRVSLNNLPRWITMSSLLISMLMTLVDPAFAGGFDKVTTNATAIQTMLKAVAVIAVTIAIIIAGYKIAFSGARFQDVWGILLGGTLIGGASGLAAWIATPDA